MFPPGIEPGTFCVLGRRDNRYTTETSSTLCLFYGLSRSLPQEELKSCRSSEGVVNKDKRCRMVKFKSHILNSSISWIASISSRDRLVVRTLRCGRSNPGSNPGLGICGSNFLVCRIHFHIWLSQNLKLTPTWLEHAAFWSGVRRATIAPRSHRYYKKDPRPNAANLLLSWKSTCLAWTLSGRCVGGIVVSIAAFQAVDPGSIPGQRKLFTIKIAVETLFHAMNCTVVKYIELWEKMQFKVYSSISLRSAVGSASVS